MSFLESPHFSAARGPCRDSHDSAMEGDDQSLFDRYPSLLEVVSRSGGSIDSMQGLEFLQQYAPLAQIVTDETGDETAGSISQTYEPQDYLGPGQGCFARASSLLKDHVSYENFAGEASRYDHITKLMAKTFNTPICHICLLCNDRVWFRSTITNEPTGGFQERCYAWCNYVMIPTEPEILITENAPVDGRFTRSPHVVGEPYLKFYAGAPLVGTGGRRYGTLCVVDFVPRTFTAELYHLLVNFAELTVQELEKDWEMLQDWSVQAVSDAKNRRRLRASLSTSTHGVAMIDTRMEEWNFTYANEMFYNTSGIGSAGGLDGDEEKLLKSGLWDTFEFVSMAEEKVVSAIAQGSTVTTLCRCKRRGHVVRLSLRPACTDQLSPGKPVGVPSWVPSERDSDDSMGLDVESVRVGDMDPELCKDVERCFYFVVLQPVQLELMDSVSSLAGLNLNIPHPEHTSQASLESDQSHRSLDSTSGLSAMATNSGHSAQSSGGSRQMSTGSLEDKLWLADGSVLSYGDFHIPQDLKPYLTMGTMIGSGCFGKVYRGKWRGAAVAVKVVETTSDTPLSMAESEAQLGLSFKNPHVVMTVVCSAQETQQQKLISGAYTRESPSSVMYMVQEYCDRGTLIDAVERAWLRTRRDVMAPPHWVHVLMTLLEIALGMEYLHSKSIVHCDLNGRNVMLCRSSKDSRGFVAKVCDFGMSRVCHGQQPVAECFGTASHMAPEQLTEKATVGPEVDVWAFGVLMWEMATGKRALIGRKFPEIVLIASSFLGHRFTMPEGTPVAYQVIFSACLQKQPRDRPNFSTLAIMLRRALREAMLESVSEA